MVLFTTTRLCNSTVKVVEIVLVGIGSDFDLLSGLVGHGGGGVGDLDSVDGLLGN